MLGARTCEAIVPARDVVVLQSVSELRREVSVPPRRSSYFSAKFLGEWIVSLVLLVTCSPLLLVLALLVKLTSTGPIFYAQTRLGRGGRLYRIYKLRTMRHDAEVHSGPVWAAKNDARITPLGRFLRDTHLDELPQLWNVLRGDMSLIGPRPERPEIAARIATRVPEFYHRLQIRPGVTGLAQMLLPADDPDDKDFNCVRLKLAHDLEYIEKASFLLDVKITVSTFCFFLAAAVDGARRNLLVAHRVTNIPSHGLHVRHMSVAAVVGSLGDDDDSVDGAALDLKIA
jgi:lipopolysaccharide/colanic/teichoic acid biosynthesis glycosyltransferase